MELRRLSTPPRVKVLEALGALADGRVVGEGGGRFRVTSSDGSRSYSVYVESRGSGRFVACSTDNGTVFRGYVGYPIISALMVLGYLPRDAVVERALSGIPWRRLNESLKRYYLVEREVLKVVSARGVASSRVEQLVSRVLSTLERYELLYDPSICGVAHGEVEDTD
jgi:hypothetical protein